MMASHLWPTQMFSRTTCMITNVKKKIKPDFWTQQIHCSIGTFSFPRETSHEEFVSRPVRVIALCIPTVYHFTRKMHAHLREWKISCSFFFARKKNYDRHVNGLGDLPFISLVCNRARSLKKIFSIQ